MNYNKKSVEDVDVQGKKVLLRCDFNVPHQGRRHHQRQADRGRAAHDSSTWCKHGAARSSLCSHMGKPKGEWKPELSLAGGGRAPGRAAGPGQ